MRRSFSGEMKAAGSNSRIIAGRMGVAGRVSKRVIGAMPLAAGRIAVVERPRAHAEA